MDIGTYIRDVINKTQGKDPTIDYTDTIEQINAITDKNLLPQKPEISKGNEYERLDYTPPTDEQIEKSAGAVLADYKQAGEQSIENEISAFEKYDCYILEDNPYGDLRFRGEPVPAIKSMTDIAAGHFLLIISISVAANLSLDPIYLYPILENIIYVNV